MKHFLEFLIYDEGALEQNMIRLFKAEQIQPDEAMIKPYAEKFKKYRNQYNLKLEDFENLTQLSDTLKAIEDGTFKTKGQKEREEKMFANLALGKDYIQLKAPAGANKDIKIFVPFNKEASCTIGGDKRYCISTRSQDYYQSYVRQGKLFFFVYNTDATNNNDSLYATVVNQKNPSRDIEFWDKTNHMRDSSHFKKVTGIDPSFFAQYAQKALDEKNKALFAALKNPKSPADMVLIFGHLQEQGYFSESDVGIDATSDFKLTARKTVSVAQVRDGKVPVPFAEVKQGFWINSRELSSFENCPREVGGEFSAVNTKITSLEHSPSFIGGDFQISSNKKLKTLAGGPRHVGGNYDTSECPLENTDGIAERIGGSFFIDITDRLTITDLPEVIEGDLYIKIETTNKATIKAVRAKFEPLLQNGEVYEF